MRSKIVRWLQTIRYLRLRQLIFQSRARTGLSPRPIRVPDKVSPRALELVPFIERPESYLGSGAFTFLNSRVELGKQTINWRPHGCSLLWQYNLHYFDCLRQASMGPEVGWRLIRDWIAQHGAVEQRAIGWQPYPLSLRIVNWLKFMRTQRSFPADVIQSLSLQATNLRRQIEYHLLGNHLLANGKALWFAGVFLSNSNWAATGKKIVLRQIGEQFLPDGGHFELSPMYHAIAVEDLLDLINLCKTSGDQNAFLSLKETVERAIAWLSELVPFSGTLPLLNDAGNGIAPPYLQLADYARRLYIQVRQPTVDSRLEFGWIQRNCSGYRVLERGDLRLIFDTALLGPDYIPGHAHCDMLSVLLDVAGRSILADTGVFEYEEGSRRIYCRSTAAHNTVSLDDLNQADLWKSFRMGKRGYPSEVKMGSSELSCEHTGFSIWRKGLKHRRTLKLFENGFEVLDSVEGPAKHRFKAYFHFAPDVTVTQVDEDRFTIDSSEVVFDVIGSDSTLTITDYYPEFGIVQQRTCLVLSGSFERKRNFALRCTYCS